CRVLADRGATALTIRWFGGEGQQPGPWEVPLETFTSALDELEGECARLAVLGTSFGAEAALLVGTVDPRVTAVVACAPTSVVWAGVDGTGRQTSHWTWEGEPLPFVPFVEDWAPESDPPAYRGLYEASLEHAPEDAEIPVERIIGAVVLLAGDDDQVWPAAAFAHRIEERRREHGLLAHVVVGPGVVVPEVPEPRGRGEHPGDAGETSAGDRGPHRPGVRDEAGADLAAERAEGVRQHLDPGQPSPHRLRDRLAPHGAAEDR